MNPDYINALAGGCLIGLAASALWLCNGKVMGISGILGTSLREPQQCSWRVSALAGLLAGGLLLLLWNPSVFTNTLSQSPLRLCAAGLLVGFGTRLGSGCTSGHGVCGMSRLSPRSIVATLAFIGAGMATVALF